MNIYNSLAKTFLSLWRIKVKYAVLLSVLPLCLTAFFFLSAYEDFDAYKKAVFPKMQLNETTIHFFTKNLLKKIRNQLFAPPVSDKSQIPSYYIEADETDLEKLDADLPASGKEQYISIKYKIDDGDTVKAKLQYRGSNNYHWLYDQKSLQIKNKNGEKINLINPPFATSIIDIVSYDIAGDLNLLAPSSYPVRVFINNQYMGVYHYFEQIDELLLRRNNRMPGSIYYGDSAKKDKAGLPILWQTDTYWAQKASRNADTEEDRSDILLLIDAVNNYSDVDFYNFYNTYMNKEKYNNFFAIDVLFGTAHHDSFHNHRIYFDPYLGKFEPIEWDLRWWAHAAKEDISIYPLLNRVKENPILEYERNKRIYELLNSDIFSIDNIMQRLYDYRDTFIEDLKSDGYRDTAVWQKISSTWVSVPFAISDFENELANYRNVLAQRQRYISGLFGKEKVFYRLTHEDQDYTKLTISVNAIAGASIDFLGLNKKTVEIYKDQNLNGSFDKEDTEIESSQIPLYGGKKREQDSLNRGGYKLTNSPLVYTFFIKNPTTLDISNVQFTNLITGEPITPELNTDTENLAAETSSIHPWLLPQETPSSVALQGTISVKDDLIYDNTTSVTIEPGTTFVIEPDKSIFFYGYVEALGTKEKPIRFYGSDYENPWGALVIQGESAANSKFSYVQVENGSDTSRNLINYTAPFNIHDVENFSINHCTIGENFIGDDSMHIAYSSGEIHDSVFHSARSDGLDVDISDVKISDTLLVNSGNDLLDFMTSNVEVKNCAFINGGDKGISVGEKTNGNFENDFFYKTTIGIEVKDESVVTLDKIFIASSRTQSINLYNKNDLYSAGGTLKGSDVYIMGEYNTVNADDTSTNKLDRIESDYPSFDDFEYLNKWTQLNKDWSNLEKEMNSIMRSFP